MRDVVTAANQAAARFGTRNPFDIASSLGIITLRVKLVDIRGFMQVIRRIGVIYVDNSLDDRQSHMVCAHELGHWFLHKGLNRAFMDTHTHFRSNRYENEANYFAVNLLFSDEELEEIARYPIEQIACVMGVPPDLAEYRMRGLQTRLC